MTATPENKALLLQRMDSHIRAVVGHFGADVGTWDVVNEVIDQSQPDGYRRSPWFNVIGPEFIEHAFRTAREAAPGAKLYINEFSTTDTAKRGFLAALVADLKSRGVPIDGVGHQMHNNIEFPSGQAIVDSINAFDVLGVENSITELDISIYSGSFPTPFTSYTDIPASRHNTVGYSYLGYIQALEQLKGKIVSVTIWGTSDDKTWLNTSTKIDAPLLFDPSLKKKPAYWAFVDPLQLPGADLSASLTAAPATVPAGQAIAYTIGVTNNVDTNQPSYAPTDDDLPATNAAMTMAIPAHTGFQALTVPAGWACSTPPVGASGPVSCTIGSLAAGASAQFGLTVAVNDCSTANGASISASANVTSQTVDPNPAPNNTASATVQVSNPPPVITANGELSTSVECHTSYTDAGAVAVDDCQGSVAVSSAGAVDVNTLGTYPITYSAVDKAGGQAAPVSRTVQVVDTTPPVVAVAGANPATVECATSFTDQGATAGDTCAGPLPVTKTGAVDTTKVGSTTLAYSAVDPSGNTGLASRTVNVTDTTPPAMDTIDLTILAPGLKIVVNNGTLTVGGLRYPLNRSVQFTVAGHTVTIQGGTITVDGFPALTGSRTIVLLPPNHNYQTFAIADLVASVSDTCSTSLGLADAVITQITSDEKLNVPGSGNTTNDVVIASDCRSAQLRIEREGGGNGRVYDVALRVLDASGNRTAMTVQVMVPVVGLSAVDDGPAYTITSACP
jgi:hypothetical protein